MPSLKSRLFLFLLKHRHWFRLQFKKPRIDWSTSIPAMRVRVDKSAARFGKMPPDITAQPINIVGIPAEWIRISGASAGSVMLYFHGGGYVMGSCNGYRGIVAKFVTGSGISALLFDYRLAPEHPFPAALDDALSVYRSLLNQSFSPARIVFAGDSAGGGLCLASLLSIRDLGLPLPAAAAVMSPWTDLKCSGSSYSRTDPMAPEGSWQVYSTYYAGSNDPGLPLISPLYADLAGLPPLSIHVGEDEAMLDDSIGFAEKAGLAGVSVELEIGQGMVHCYPAFSPMFPEAKAALDSICAFLKKHCGT